MQVIMIALEVITQQPLLLSHIGCVSKDYAWGGQVLCGTYLYIFSTVIPPDEGVDTVEQRPSFICFRLTGSVPSKCYFNRRSLGNFFILSKDIVQVFSKGRENICAILLEK